MRQALDCSASMVLALGIRHHAVDTTADEISPSEMLETTETMITVPTVAGSIWDRNNRTSALPGLDIPVGAATQVARTENGTHHFLTLNAVPIACDPERFNREKQELPNVMEARIDAASRMAIEEEQILDLLLSDDSSSLMPPRDAMLRFIDLRRPVFSGARAVLLEATESHRR